MSAFNNGLITPYYRKIFVRAFVYFVVLRMSSSKRNSLIRKYPSFE